VPQWGTNIANDVKEHGLIRRFLIDGLRGAVIGSQVPVLGALENWLATSAANHKHPDLLFAVRDALSEAEPVCAGRGVRGATAQEAASELALWLRHMGSDFSAIDDLLAWRPCGGNCPEPASPAHFTPRLRERELGYWRDWRIQTTSFATIGPPPGHPGTDFVYRICYRACSSGPFQYPPHLTHYPVSVSDNDGIVNTASMLWPDPEAELAECDHMDIVGHYRSLCADKNSGRKYKAYDLLCSQSGFGDRDFARVWQHVFDSCV
jgi:hypothetical protein